MYSESLISKVYPNQKHYARGFVSDLCTSQNRRFGNNADMENNIREMRKKLGLSLEAVAYRAGTTRATIMKLEKGDMSLTVKWMERIAKALYCSPSDLLADNKIKQSIVVGYVGAGIVHAYDDHAQGNGLELVENPIGINKPDIVAVRVRGDSMRPMLYDNWLLFYSREHDGVPSDCIGRVCIVKLIDDGVAVRELKQGSKPGYYHLIAYNGETTFDAKLKWAARVLDIRPN